MSCTLKEGELLSPHRAGLPHACTCVSQAAICLPGQGHRSGGPAPTGPYPETGGPSKMSVFSQQVWDGA